MFWALFGCGVALVLNWDEIKQNYGIRLPNLWVAHGMQEITKDKGTVTILHVNLLAKLVFY